MAAKFGFLLPTRENIMRGQPDAAPLLALAERAESLGYESVWVGDSLLARPRHEPLTLLAGVAGRTRTITLGTAVLLPALRNPVLLAHQVATLDQVSAGRFILGVGIALDVPNVHAEFAAAGVPFDKRVGRMLEGLKLCKALWTGEPVDWDGRWPVAGGVLAPTPHQPGGPPIWGGGSAPGALDRAGRHFDGWFPIGPDAATCGRHWGEVQAIARDAGRDPTTLTQAIYLTLAIDDDARIADARINDYLQTYYGVASASLRAWQACYGGPAAGAVDWIGGYADAGASHMVLRFVGDHQRHLDLFARVREQLS